MSIEDVLKDTSKAEAFTKRFKEFAASIGEFILEPLTVEQVADRFITQGYWSGTEHRIEFNAIDGTFTAQPRLFGAHG